MNLSKRRIHWEKVESSSSPRYSSVRLTRSLVKFWPAVRPGGEGFRRSSSSVSSSSVLPAALSSARVGDLVGLPAEEEAVTLVVPEAGDPVLACFWNRGDPPGEDAALRNPRLLETGAGLKGEVQTLHLLAE